MAITCACCLPACVYVQYRQPSSPSCVPLAWGPRRASGTIDQVHKPCMVGVGMAAHVGRHCIKTHDLRCIRSLAHPCDKHGLAIVICNKHINITLNWQTSRILEDMDEQEMGSNSGLISPSNSYFNSYGCSRQRRVSEVTCALYWQIVLKIN